MRHVNQADALKAPQNGELHCTFPGNFIPLFEKHGLIGEVNNCIREKAARQAVLRKSRFGQINLFLDLAKEMKVPVIAEGVEDKMERMMLKEMGCKLAGLFFLTISADSRF